VKYEELFVVATIKREEKEAKTFPQQNKSLMLAKLNFAQQSLRDGSEGKKHYKQIYHTPWRLQLQRGKIS
jgi:hypothetical protein